MNVGDGVKRDHGRQFGSFIATLKVVAKGSNAGIVLAGA